MEKIRFTGKNVEISDLPDVKEVVKLKVSDLVILAEEQFVNKDLIKGKIEDSENQMPQQCKATKESQCRSPPTITKKQMLEKYCPNALSQFENLINQNVNPLNSNLDSDKLDVSLSAGIKSKVNDEPETEPSTCTTTSVQADECGCKRSGKFGCLEYYPKYTKTCTYDYSASVGALVNIKDKENRHPIFDPIQKRTALRNLEMNFYVLSGEKSLGLPDNTPILEVPAIEGFFTTEPAISPSLSLPSDCPLGWPTGYGWINQGPAGTATHTGPILEAVDIHGERGTAVYATHNGVVAYAGKDSYGGGYVKIQGQCAGKAFSSYYVHLIDRSVTVSAGQTISRGTKIGGLDCTGFCTYDHVHYEFKGLTMAPPYIPQNVPRGCVGFSGCGKIEW